MTMISEYKKVGELVRIEMDQDGKVRMVIEITDNNFKNRVVNDRRFMDMIELVGKDVVLVDSKMEE